MAFQKLRENVRARFKPVISPDEEQPDPTWEDQRVKILKHMLEYRDYQYYLDILKNLVDTINTVLSKDHVMTETQRALQRDNPRYKLDSSEFDKSNELIRGTFCDDANESWWKQDFEELDIDEFDVVGLFAQFATNKKVVDLAVTQQSWMADYQQMLISTCISAYFRQTPEMIPVHRNMRYALSKGGSESWLEIPQAYIAGAGPFLIKTLQQVSNGLKSGQHLKTITESVFSTILPMTKGELAVVRENLDIAPQYKNFEDKSIGSASIGETHKCFSPDGKTPIAVLKFIKPVSAFMFLCEVDFLLKTVWLDLYTPDIKPGSPEAMNVKKCRQLLLFLIREFALEFDVEREAQGTRDAREIYFRPDIGIITPALLDYNPVPVPVLVLQYIDGQSLETFMEEMGKLIVNPAVPNKYILHCLVPIQRRIAMLMGLWLKELFWGSGRFDADPHKGNVMVPRCEDLHKGAKPWIALIDFGSHGKLERRAQCIVFKTLIAGERITQLKQCMPKTRTENNPTARQRAGGIQEHYDAQTEYYLGVQPLLRYFKEFKTMSQRDQAQLMNNVTAEVAKNPKLHTNNLKHVREVISNIYKICNIREDPVESEFLVENSINYGKEVDFGSIMLSFAQNAQTIGTCSSSSVLMYGRGLAYLDQMWRMSSELCTSVEDDRVINRSENDLLRYLGVGVQKCDRRKLIGLIWTFFVTKPRLTFDFATGCFFAKEEPKKRAQDATKREKASSRAQAST